MLSLISVKSIIFPLYHLLGNNKDKCFTNVHTEKKMHHRDKEKVLYFLSTFNSKDPVSKDSHLKRVITCSTLARWLTWLKHRPVHQEITGSIPAQVIYLGWRFDPQSSQDVHRKKPMDVSLLH